MFYLQGIQIILQLDYGSEITNTLFGLSTYSSIFRPQNPCSYVQAQHVHLFIKKTFLSSLSLLFPLPSATY